MNSATLHYRDGSWYALVRPLLALVLPPTEQPAIASWWKTVSEVANLAQLVDELGREGRAPDGYVALSWRDRRPELIVRGPVQVDLSAPESRGEAAWSPWVPVPGQLQALPKGVGVRVVVDVGGHDWTLPLTEGVVRAGALILMPTSDATSGATPSDHGDADPPTAESPVLEYDDLFGESVLHHPEEAAVRPPPTAEELVGPPAGPRHRARRRTRSSGTGQEPAPEREAPASRLRLTLPNGDAIDLDQVVVVGRAPFVRESDPAVTPRLVKLGERTGDVSRNHVELRPTSDGAAVAVDLGSTNGTVLVRPGMAPQQLEADLPVRLTAGCVLELGRHVDLVVSAAT